MSFDLEPITERAHDAFAWIVHNWVAIVICAAMATVALVLI